MIPESPVPPPFREVEAIDQASPFVSEWTARLCLGIPVALLLFLFIAVILNAYRRAVAARIERRAGEPLVPGFAVVRGRLVEPENELSDPPLRVRIRQKGTVTVTKNGRFTRWREIGRELSIRPFELLTPHGDRVRVMPDDDLLLLDAISRTEDNGLERFRIAELTQDEEIVVCGALERESSPVTVDDIADRQGYRAVGHGASWVMRRPSADRMTVATQPMTTRFSRRVRRDVLWGIAWLIVAGVYHSMHASYRAVDERGMVIEPRNAEIVSSMGVCHGSRGSGNYPCRVWSARGTYTTPEGEDLQLDTSIRPAPVGPATLRARIVPFPPYLFVFGGRATMNGGTAVISWGTLILFLGFFFAMRREGAESWFDVKRLNETVQG